MRHRQHSSVTCITSLTQLCVCACAFVFVCSGSVLPDVSTAAPKAANRPPAQVTASHPGMPADEFAERCEAEPEVGPCRASFMRWYYDSKTRTCQSFIFGGCQGNMNNYENMESCIDACTVKVVLPSQKSLTKEEYDEYCTADSDPGPCRAAFHMFYYNRKTGTCQSFIYGGCRGNLNRYSTAEECFTRCSNEGSFSGHNKSRSHWTAAFFLFSILAAISALLLAALIFIALRRKLNRRPSSVSDKEELLPDPDEHSSVESLSVQESPGVDKA
ncbi:hypothetical protein LDENG_00121710 [Lucifuga dentata]|nr:hypothetical protein LDENG_00121710 [Lucifuga dentata]